MKSIYRLFREGNLMPGYMKEVGQIEPYEHLKGKCRTYEIKGKEIREILPHPRRAAEKGRVSGAELINTNHQRSWARWR